MLLKSMVDEMAGILTSSEPVEGGCAPLSNFCQPIYMRCQQLEYYNKACFPGHLIGGNRPVVRGMRGQAMLEPITCGIL
jgi:hypothetical protein